MASRLVELGNLGQLHKIYSKLDKDYVQNYKTKGGKQKTRVIKAKKITKKNRVPAAALPKKSLAVIQRDKKMIDAFKKLPYKTRSIILDKGYLPPRGKKSAGDLKALLSAKTWTPEKKVPKLVSRSVKKIASKKTLEKRYKKAKKKGPGRKMSFAKKGKTKGSQFYISGEKDGAYRKKLGLFDLQEIGQYGKKSQKRKSGLSKKKKIMGQPWLDAFVPLRYEPLFIFGGNFAGAVATRLSNAILSQNFGLSQAWSSGLTTAALAGIQYSFVPKGNTKARSFVFGMILSSLASTIEGLIDLVATKAESFLKKTGALKGIQQSDSKSGPMSTMAGNARYKMVKGGKRRMRGTATGLTSPNAFGGAINPPNMGRAPLSEQQIAALEHVKRAYGG